MNLYVRASFLRECICVYEQVYENVWGLGLKFNSNVKVKKGEMVRG